MCKSGRHLRKSQRSNTNSQNSNLDWLLVYFCLKGHVQIDQKIMNTLLHVDEMMIILHKPFVALPPGSTFSLLHAKKGEPVYQTSA